MMKRVAGVAVAIGLFTGVAVAQPLRIPVDGVRAVDFSVHLLLEESGELSPDIFKLGEFFARNFSAHWKGSNGGRFSGFLIRVKLQSNAQGDVFAQGTQARVVLRDRKTKKELRSWTIADVYVGDKGVGYRAQFFAGLDCQAMEATLISGGARTTRDLPFSCGE